MYDELNPVERYFENNEVYSKEVVDELVNAYNGNYRQLAEDFNMTGEDEAKNHEILVETMSDLMNRYLNKLKEIIARAGKIHSPQDTSAKELFEMKAFVEHAGMSITNIYMVDVMLNDTQLYPEEVTKQMYALEEDAHRVVDELIANITQDELVFRAIQIKKGANDIMGNRAEMSQEEISDTHSVVRVCDDFIYYKLQTEAFEEEHYNPENLFVEKSYHDINGDLFRKKLTKEEILNDILLPIDSFDERMNLIKYIFKDYEAYLGERKGNMGRLLEAYANMAEYEIGRLKMKICALTEEDNFKASMIAMCRKQYEAIEKATRYISSEYRSLYHPDAGDPIMEKMMNIDSGDKMSYSCLESIQMKRLFHEIKEKEDELKALHEKNLDEFGGLSGIIMHTPEADAYRHRVVEIQKEIDEILTKLATEEARGTELFAEIL